MNRILLNELITDIAISFAERPGIHFKITKVIGRGASCVVYHAVGSDNTEHLLKEYYPKYLELIRDSSGNIVVPEDKKELFEQGLTRFRTGCERQKNIRLSNEDLKNFTCNVQGYYAANGTEYIDMTCFNGRTYDHVQEKSVYHLMLRMRTLAQVIGNYHKAGLLHLDIKPENIYVRPEGETIEDVMLFDFDSVTPMNEIAVSKALSCTKTWAAPEQLLPEKRRSICPATDLFAIGEIIFVQLFGRHSTSAERRSFVSKYVYDHNVEIFKDINPKVFSLLDDLLCHTICGVVGKRYQSAEELSAKLDEIIKFANPEVPYLKSSLPAVQDFFVGRETEIAEIHCRLSENRILFLNGIGGIGKSELAKHYAQEHKDDYDAIIFAPYVSDVNMLLQDDTAIPLYNFSRYPEEKPEEYCARKLRKLQELCDERTLFIVDNLDREDDPDLNKLLDLGCKLLITTRMDFSDYGYGQQLYLDALENRDKINELFLHHYTKPLSDEEQNCVAQIIDIVGGHTMTVELLAKQMMAGRVKPDKMLAKLQDGGISESGKEKVRSGKDGVLSAQSTYGHIQALFDLSGVDEDERYILANLSLIPHTGISVELFHDWCELDDYEGINRLVVEGWVRLDKEKDYISLHPVVGDIVCQIPDLEMLCSTVLKHVSKLSFSENKLLYNNEYLVDVLIYSLQKICKLNFSTRQAANFLRSLSTQLQDFGNLDILYMCHKQALAIRMKSLGKYHHDVALSYKSLANLLCGIGKINDAEKFCEQALEIYQKLDGVHSKPYINALLELGIIYKLQNKYDASFELISQAKEYYINSTDDNTYNLLRCYMHLGDICFLKQNISESIFFFDLHLNLSIQKYGISSPQVAQSLTYLSTTYRDNNIEKSFEYGEQALANKIACLGDHHAAVAQSYSSLGMTYLLIDDKITAEKYLCKAQKIREDLYGAEHRSTAISYFRLGLLYEKKSDYAKAKEFLEKALTIRLKLYGNDHPETVEAVEKLASLCAGGNDAEQNL